MKVFLFYKNFFLFLFLNLLWLGLFVPLRAQTSYGFHFKHITPENGLTHTTVHAILQDHYGFMWFGTRYGLNRYDGFDFRHFFASPEEGVQKAGHTIYCLWEHNNGDIWVGFKESGIKIFNRHTEKFRDFTPSGAPYFNWKTITVRKIFRDSRGDIWIGTYNGGAMLLGKDLTVKAHFHSRALDPRFQLSNDFVFDFEEDAFGRVWIATGGTGIDCFDPAENGKTTFLDFHPAPDSWKSFDKSLCIDANQNLWIGVNGNGLYRYGINTQQLRSYVCGINATAFSPSNNFITDVAADENGDIWITTDGAGLSLFKANTETFLHIKAYSENDGLNTNALYTLKFDSNKNLWIGTFNGGVNILKKRPPEVQNWFQDKDRFPPGPASILSIGIAKDQSVWFAIDGGGLLQYQNGPYRQFRKANSGLPTDVITKVLPRSDGQLWLGTFSKGLVLFNPATGKTQVWQHHADDPYSLVNNNVWDILENGKGDLWVATLGGGLHFKPADSNQFIRYLPEENNPKTISGVEVIAILFDHNGVLWAATLGYGLNRFDAERNEFVHYRHEPGNPASLSSDRIKCLHEDFQHRLWVGTEGGGLNLLDPEKGVIKCFTTSDGLPSNLIEAIQTDKLGFVWVSTNNGIARLEPESGAITIFNAEDGLPGQQFNASATALLSDGRLIFGGIKGFAMVNPSSVISKNSPPKVLLSSLDIFNRPVPFFGQPSHIKIIGDLNDPGAVIKVSYQENSLTLHFAALVEDNTQKLRFAYRLLGFEPDWRYTDGTHRSATYTNLSGGKYFFEVKSCEPGGTWSDPVRSIQLYVDPPFWKTWWFRGLMVIGLLLLAFFLMRFFLIRQKEAFERHAIEADAEILRLQNQTLEQELIHKEERLGAVLLQTAHKNQFLNKLKNHILASNAKTNLESTAVLRKILGAIDSEIDDADYWEQFQMNFDQMYQNFMDRLSARHPGLTTNDYRLCCFVRMRLTNREIAAILNITLAGVEKSKYRLRSKLNLTKDQNLQYYLVNEV